jgi:hypothetical protein
MEDMTNGPIIRCVWEAIGTVAIYFFFVISDLFRRKNCKNSLMNFNMSVFLFVCSFLRMQNLLDCWKRIFMKFHRYWGVLLTCAPLLECKLLTIYRKKTSMRKQTWIWCPKVLRFETSLSIFNYLNGVDVQKKIVIRHCFFIAFCK